MSRLRFKGGAWTNSEDEVLRASLTVYGLQNWERVASMLVRKTAAQCRERWENFLDPRLHIQEPWTAAEEEWLVQLQSLFANQWNLISRELRHRCKTNRPAWLCEEHYHSLLDALEYERQRREGGRNNKNGSLTLEDFIAERKRHRATHQGYETRAARPDAVNADVFEKEMVEFAVSRLANQDGKKGLRKERKKQLEHTSFLAKLQSNREAIESGTLSAKAKKRMERAMLEDITGPIDTKLRDDTAEGDISSDSAALETDGAKSGEERSVFQPIELGADKREAGIQAKKRVLVKDISSEARHLTTAAEPDGVDVKELLRLAGSATTAASNLLEGRNDKLLTTYEDFCNRGTKKSTATSSLCNETDFDNLFASLPDVVEPMNKSTKDLSTVVDLFSELPAPKPQEEALEDNLFSDDIFDSVGRIDVDKSRTPEKELFFPQGFDSAKWNAWMQEARRRVSVEAERAFFSCKSSTSLLLDSDNGTTKDDTGKKQGVLDEDNEKKEEEECIVRLVQALVAQQLPEAARSLLNKNVLLDEPLRKKMKLNKGDHSNSNNNNNGNDNDINVVDKKNGSDKNDAVDLLKELAVRVAEAQQESGYEYWRYVGATEATMKLEELLQKQREQLAAVTAADRKEVERIVRICFAGGRVYMSGDDVLRRACVHWGAQLEDAQRKLAIYSRIRESELKEIQWRLDDATSRLLEAKTKEKLLQEQYRSMRIT